MRRAGGADLAVTLLQGAGLVVTLHLEEGLEGITALAVEVSGAITPLAVDSVATSRLEAGAAHPSRTLTPVSAVVEAAPGSAEASRLSASNQTTLSSSKALPQAHAAPSQPSSNPPHLSDQATTPTQPHTPARSASRQTANQYPTRRQVPA